jgi:hypothetical protein
MGPILSAITDNFFSDEYNTHCTHLVILEKKRKKDLIIGPKELVLLIIASSYFIDGFLLF